MTCFVPACFWSVCGYSARAVPTEVTHAQPKQRTNTIQHVRIRQDLHAILKYIHVNTHWEEQKKIIQAMLSEVKIGAIYRKRKIDVEPVFGFLKANLGFTRFSLRGKSKVRNEIGRTLMATNLRKYAMRG